MSDTSLTRDELKAHIEAGIASDDEIATYLGPDLMNELNAQFTDEYSLDDQVRDWYDAVMRPLGIPLKTTRALYTGQMTIGEFAASLTKEQTATFEARYEGLQTAYQHRLDERSHQ